VTRETEGRREGEQHSNRRDCKRVAKVPHGQAVNPPSQQKRGIESQVLSDRQSKNSAIRAGMSERSYHRWKAHWENAKFPGPPSFAVLARNHACACRLGSAVGLSASSGGARRRLRNTRIRLVFFTWFGLKRQAVTVRKLVMPNLRPYGGS